MTVGRFILWTVTIVGTCMAYSSVLVLAEIMSLMLLERSR